MSLKLWMSLLIVTSLLGCSLDADLQSLLKLDPKISVSLISPADSVSNASVIPVTIKLSEDVQDLTVDKIQVTNGTISNFSGNGSEYTFDVTPNGDGVVSVIFPSTKLMAGDNTKKTTTSGTLVFSVDRVSPTVQLTTTASSPTNVASIPVAVNFTESVTGLTISDFVVTGGGAAITSLTGSGSSYVLNVLATVSGSMSIQLPASTVADAANNGNFASNTLTVIYDVNVPLPVLASTAPAVNHLSSIPVTVSFGSVSVFNLTDSDFTVTNGTISGFTGTGSSYSLDLIPSGDGAVSIQLPAGVAENSLGTLNLASNTLTFNVDRVAPTLAIVGPTPAIGNSSTSFVWTVNYSGADSISLASGNISFGGTATAGCSAVVSGSGTASRTVTVSGCTGNGNLNISVPANSAQDTAGNQALAAGPSSDATVDNTGPTLAIVGPSPVLGNSSTGFVWTVNYTGANTVSLTDANVSLGGTATTGCLKSVTGSGTASRTVTISGCTGNGSLNISISANTAQDTLGNQALAAGPSSDATVDNIAPTLVIGTASPLVGNSSTTFKWPVTYTGADVISLNSADISLTGTGLAGCNVAITGSGTMTRTVEISGCSAISGTVGFSIAANSAHDNAGNQALAAGPSGLATIDNSNLTIVLASTASSNTNLSSIPVTVSASSSTSDFDVSDLTLVNATVTGFTGSGSSYSFSLIPSGDGAVSVQVPAGAAHDSVPNANLASNLLSFNVDRVAPTLAIVGPTPTVGNSSTNFVWTVNYTGADSISLVTGEVSLGGTGTTGCSTVVSGTGTASRTVTVSGCTGDGNLNISIPANSAQDAAGNQALAAGPSSDATVDNTGPTLAIVGPTPVIGNSSTNFVWTVNYTNADAITLADTDVSLGGAATVGCVKAVTGSGTSTRTVTVSGCTGNGSLNISIAANSAYDNAGNQAAAAGPSSDATVDNTAPTLAIVGPSPTIGNSSTNFVWTVNYTNADTITLANADVSLGGTGTAGCLKSVTGSGASTRTVTISGCAGNGSLYISVAANSAHDNAGNQAAAAGPSSDATVDNTGPTLAIVGPSPALGNSGTSFIWTLNYTDASAVSLTTGNISLTGTATAGCSIGLSGTGLASRTVTVTNCSGTGNMGISVAANTAQDALNNPANSAVSGLATLDNTAPTLLITGPSPVSVGNSSASFIWTVTYSDADAVTLANADISLGGTGTAGCTKAVTGSGATTRTVTISNCSGNGNLNISVAANSAHDTLGNQAAAAGPSSDATVDNTAPTLLIIGPTPTIGNSTASFVWTVTYSGADSVSLVTGNITLGGTGTTGCTRSVTGSGTTTRTVTVSGCTGNGSLNISIPANSAQDTVGNQALAAGPSSDATVDNIAPTLVISSPAANSMIGNVSNFVVTGTCNENGRTLTLNPAAKTTVTCSSGTWSAEYDLSATVGDTVTLNFSLSDLAGNSVSTSRIFALPGAKVVNIFANIESFAALKSDGSIVAWGQPSYGGTAPSSVTTANSKVVSILGNDLSLSALKSDGSVVAWGDAGYGGNTSPADVSSNIIELCSNNNALAALKANGSVVSWGHANSGGNGLATASNTKKVFSNGAAFAALKADGSVETWGSATNGAGNYNASTNPMGAPTTVTNTNSSVAEIFGTNSAFSALKSTGGVIGWGTWTSGSAPSSGVKTISSNFYSFAALTTGGAFTAWGEAAYGGSTPGGATDAKKIISNLGAFAALKSDGSVLTWGSNSYGGTGAPTSVTAADSKVVEIYSSETGSAFAALKANGTVVAWGDASHGGSAPSSVTNLGSNVVEIFGHDFSFAALKADGSVVSWGGTAAPASVTAANSKVVKIFSTKSAFAALKSDGAVVAWGGSGGDTTSVATKLAGSQAGAKEVTANSSAFAVLKADGSVEASGNTANGGITPGITGVKKIFRTETAFAALKSDGTVTAWGNTSNGGSSPAVTNVKSISNTKTAFAALDAGGYVTAWGDALNGGTTPAVTNVAKIFGNDGAFVALKSDGSVSAWGNSAYGGIHGGSTGAPTTVTNASSGVIEVFSNKTAFAALKVTGAVIAWGDTVNGGTTPAGVTTSVKRVYSNDAAFVALKSDGSVVSWGAKGSGGEAYHPTNNPTGAPTSITNANSEVTEVFRTATAFAALKGTGVVVAWGNTLNGGSAPSTVTSPGSVKVKTIVGTDTAFAALMSSGNVVAWGDTSNGGSAPGISNAKKIFSTKTAFAVLKSDGSVVAWGNTTNGGSAPASVTNPNSGVVSITSSDTAFVARKSDGSVVTWGSNP